MTLERGPAPRRLVFTGWPSYTGNERANVERWRAAGARWRERCPGACLRCAAQRGELIEPGSS